MKRFTSFVISIAFLTLFLIMYSQFAADAATKMDYENFSVELPQNWTAEKDTNGNFISFFSADGSEVLQIFVKRPFNTMSSKEFADSVCARSDGYDFKDNGDGLYSFKYNLHEVECRELVGVYGNTAIAIVTAGKSAELKALAASIGIKILFNPKTESLF